MLSWYDWVESEFRLLELEQYHTIWYDLKGHTSLGGVSESRLLATEKRLEEMFKQLTSMKVHSQELELQLQASLASTHNGSFLWRIPEVSRRRRDAIDERVTSIYSPPFYTGRLVTSLLVMSLTSIHEKFML